MEQRLQKVNQDGLIETAKETGVDPFRYLILKSVETL